MSTSSSRRRIRARERRLRQAALAAQAAPPDTPLTWGAGWGSRALALTWLVQQVLIGPFSYDRDVTQFTAVDWFFRIWALAVSGWILGRLAAWKVTADRDGLWIPRLWGIQRIPWDRTGEAICRKDGSVTVHNRTLGPFFPPTLARRLRRPATAEAVADHLTIMARHPHLRPTTAASRSARGLAYAAWTPLPLVVTTAAHLIRSWMA
ncbi:hypothetical protein [Streptomyces wuyuanensis]|uniref:hypothetical protein n=1 Tax=Streptomyces wuyuanensis TaxID=1196353 RepID=UPI0037210582